MAGEKKTYVTTERAGYVIAGRRVPVEYVEKKDTDGNPITTHRPQVGFELDLLDMEAEYELSQGTIALKAADAKGKTAKSKSDPSGEPAKAV